MKVYVIVVEVSARSKWRAASFKGRLMSPTAGRNALMSLHSIAAGPHKLTFK